MTTDTASGRRTCQGPGCTNGLGSNPRQRYCSSVCATRAYRARTSPLAPRVARRAGGSARTPYRGVTSPDAPTSAADGPSWWVPDFLEFARRGDLYQASLVWRWFRERHPDHEPGPAARQAAAELGLDD